MSLKCSEVPATEPSISYRHATRYLTFRYSYILQLFDAVFETCGTLRLSLLLGVVFSFLFFFFLFWFPSSQSITDSTEPVFRLKNRSHSFTSIFNPFNFTISQLSYQKLSVINKKKKFFFLRKKRQERNVMLC